MEKNGTLKERTLKRTILTALTIAWMIFIFFMSSMEQEESASQSSTVIDFICSVFVRGYSEMPPAVKLEMQEKLTFPVRKGAHMTEYAILGMLLSLTVYEYFVTYENFTVKNSGLLSESEEISEKKALPPALVIGFLYACSDEIHQIFVRGRSGEIRDVLIDTTGVLAGAFLITYFFPALSGRRKKS